MGPVEWHDELQVGIAMFPEGLQVYYEREARVPLYRSEHPLLAPSHASLRFHGEATPAFLPRAGVGFDLEPIAFFDCGVRVYGTYWLGTFSAMIPTDSPSFAGTRDERKALVDDGARSAGWSLREDLHARLKGKVGRVIALVEFEARHHHAETLDGEFAYWWEPSEMLTIASDSWVLDRKAWLFAEVVRAADDTDRRVWIGAVAMDMSAPSTGDHSLRIGTVALIKPTAQPAMPMFVVGSFAWVESRFAPMFPPYTVVAARWTR